MMRTPSFIVWALARHCPLRQIPDWENPERTERLLRAARAFDEARSGGRIVDGVALAAHANAAENIQQVLAFRVEEALSVYGGAAALHAACDACPANALKGYGGRQLVGCFGMWPLPSGLSLFYDEVQAALATEPLAADLASRTKPGWFGLWLDSPLAGPAAASVGSVLRRVRIFESASAAGRDEFVLALNAAAGGIPLHFLLYPRGEVAGQWWNLVPHCECCKAPWSGQGRCVVCGRTSSPAAPKKRHIRGQRPYRPLVGLVGLMRARALEKFARQNSRE